MLIAFCGMVKDNIQKYFNSVLIEGPDQVFQFISLTVIFGAGCVARVWGKKADGIVAPVIIQFFSIDFPVVLHFIKFKDGHQFYHIDAKLQKIGKLFHQSCERSGFCHAGRAMHGKTPDMKLIYDQILHRKKRRPHILPVKIILYNPCFIMLAAGRSRAPSALAGYSLGVRIQKVFVFVEDQPFLWFIWSVYAVSVLELFNIQFENDHGIYISYPVMCRERKHCKRLLLLSFEKKQLNRGGIVRIDCKINTSGNCGGSVGFIKSRTDIKTVNMVHGNKVYGAGKVKGRYFCTVFFHYFFHFLRPFFHYISAI